jgi:hypothetical protein
MGASLAEQASTLAEWGLPRAGLLILMSPCENRCYFCAQPAVTHPPPEDWTPPERVGALLEQNRSLGLDRLCIGGTEPLTHPSFTDALRQAKDVGFSDIELMTSGLRLAQPGVADAWRDAGITRIAVPIYSADREVHDGVCGTRCHTTLIDGLDRAQSAGLHLSLHTLALRRTVSGLPDLSRLCQERWSTSLALAPARPKDGVWDFESEAPSLAEVGAGIRDIPSTHLTLMGWPACFEADRNRGGSLVMSLYFLGQARVHAAVCTDCSARSRCAGLVSSLHTRDGSTGLRSLDA